MRAPGWHAMSARHPGGQSTSILARRWSFAVALSCVGAVAVGCVPLTPAPQPMPPPTTPVFMCRYAHDGYVPDEGALRLEPDGRIFGRIREARRPGVGVQLAVPYGSPAQGVRASFTSSAVTIDTQYTPDWPLRLRLTAPLVFSPVLSWQVGDEVYWSGSAGPSLMRVTVAPLSRFVPVGPLDAVVGCEGTTIGWPLPVAETRPQGEPAQLVGVEVPVSGAPGGTVDGHLWLDEGTRVGWLGAEGEWVHVRVALHPGVVDGWVPAARVRRLGPDAIAGDGSGGLGLRGSGAAGFSENVTRCENEAMLHVAGLGLLLKPVGRVHAGAAVMVGASHNNWVEVYLPEMDWVQLEPGVGWAMSALQLSRCAPGPGR